MTIMKLFLHIFLPFSLCSDRVTNKLQIYTDCKEATTICRKTLPFLFFYDVLLASLLLPVRVRIEPDVVVGNFTNHVNETLFSK